MFSLAFLFSKEIRQEYRDRNNGKDNLVRINDAFFSLHALFLCTITLIQSFIYRVSVFYNEHPTIIIYIIIIIMLKIIIKFYKRDPNQKISSITSTFIIGSLVITIFFLIGIHSSKIQWIDLLYYLSFIKISISCIKYIPQVNLLINR